jgi:hypothetical protein
MQNGYLIDQIVSSRVQKFKVGPEKIRRLAMATTEDTIYEGKKTRAYR